MAHLIRKLTGSFSNAFRGIYTILASQVNFRIHLLIMAIAVAGGLLFKISAGEWTAVILSSGLVLAAECMNTAVEFLGDSVTKDENPHIRKAKDVAAAGVLLAAIAAAIVGLVVFFPYFLKLFG
ncbi:MAG TPA: diacylglycerol kinase family protein [Bacteroidales bacterium]|nr:diacylglycerol kinase family protein [Bacteroidales bacterium]HRR92960.1 diacylglycerol kinase family protein [Bacteroidales bacterium]HRT90688.1 diacylglycerol kinase family protein [Bacteroidales bacterium]